MIVKTKTRSKKSSSVETRTLRGAGGGHGWDHRGYVSHMRLVLLAVSSTLVLASCGGERESGGACAAGLSWRGDFYAGTGRDGHRAGAPLPDGAVVPGCNDGGPHESDHKTTVRRVGGVDPLFAVWMGGTLYINSSTFPELRSHPLHRTATERRGRPRRGDNRCRVSGEALVDLGGLYLARAGQRRIRVNIAADTDVQLQRAGSGYIRDKTPIVVEGRQCVLAGDEARLWARRISPA